jgi:hypothetical protein
VVRIYDGRGQPGLQEYRAYHYRGHQSAGVECAHFWCVGGNGSNGTWLLVHNNRDQMFGEYTRRSTETTSRPPRLLRFASVLPSRHTARRRPSAGRCADRCRVPASPLRPTARTRWSRAPRQMRLGRASGRGHRVGRHDRGRDGRWLRAIEADVEDRRRPARRPEPGSTCLLLSLSDASERWPAARFRERRVEVQVRTGGAAEGETQEPGRRVPMSGRSAPAWRDRDAKQRGRSGGGPPPVPAR